ncbi:hypothetical protein EV421DRAFT_1740613 [Armillaria borealis]|uniref:Uncharacterized protein n=1 Tax=Armillaria borealis TaxID=47425 RepID=A0AA39J5N5_9AGAR|nr:hypothetical protein EV421DRAFT_1740613 [Armillaria borealis]
MYVIEFLPSSLELTVLPGTGPGRRSRTYGIKRLLSRLRDKSGSIIVDIGVNYTGSIHITDMIKEDLENMPELRLLVLAARRLLVRSGVNDSTYGDFGSYAVVSRWYQPVTVAGESSLPIWFPTMVFHSRLIRHVLPKLGAAWRRADDKLVIQYLKNPKNNIVFCVKSQRDICGALEVTIRDPVVFGAIVATSFFQIESYPHVLLAIPRFWFEAISIWRIPRERDMDQDAEVTECLLSGCGTCCAGMGESVYAGRSDAICGVE